MAIEWDRDLDTQLTKAREADRPILLDFSAAPM